MLYLDTSALVKLIRREPESDALADWLDAQDPKVLERLRGLDPAQPADWAALVK